MTARDFSTSKLSFSSVRSTTHFFSKFLRKSFIKLVAYFVLVTFTTTQVAWGQGTSITKEPVTSSRAPFGSVAISDADLPAGKAGIASSTSSPRNDDQSITNFLSNTLTLTPPRHSEESEALSFPYGVDGNPEDGSDVIPTEVEESRKVSHVSSPQPPTPNLQKTITERERFSFDYALDLFEPEYAAAVVVDDLKEEDIEALLELDFEVGIVVLEGEYVLFSTGNSNELGATPAAKTLLAQASFISHTHVDAGKQNGPSAFDLANAITGDSGWGIGNGDSAIPQYLPPNPELNHEYVLTKNGAYVYRKNEELNQGRPISIKDYLSALKLAKSLGDREWGIGDGQSPNLRPLTSTPQPLDFVSQASVRDLLASFIVEMDRYNEAEATRETFRASGSTQTLSDNTVLHFDVNGVLEKEVTPAGDEIYFLSDGRTEKFIYSDGTTIEYTETIQTGGVYPVIQIKDSAGVVIETIDEPSPTELDETVALKVTLEGGVDAYYIDGNLVEFRLSTGASAQEEAAARVRVTDFTLDSNDDIVDAYIVYQDGAVDVIRKGSLLRRMGADGTILDFTPTDYAVRELPVILSEVEESLVLETPRHFSFEKTSQNAVNESKIFTLDSNGDEENVIRYDELGILIQAKEGAIKDYTYLRESYSEIVDYGDSTSSEVAYRITLDLTNSTIPSTDTLIEARYTSEGRVVKLIFQDGNMLLFNASGEIHSTTDANGNPVNYDYLSENSFVQGLKVNRKTEQLDENGEILTDANGNTVWQDVTFNYEQDGFLSQIQLEDGSVINRTLKKAGEDGNSTSEDIIDLLLEEVGGNRLMGDFHIDENGTIVSGIIETKEGIKQYIANEALTGFETVDGRFYNYDATNKKAELAEWIFSDGTKVTFGGQTITEVLFPNGNKIKTLGLSSNREVSSYIEEVTDENGGVTKKYYESPVDENLKQPRLTKIETASNTRILYGIEGLAYEVTLHVGGSEEQTFEVSYSRNSDGEILEVNLLDEHENRTFTPEGNLVKLLHKGISAEIENESIRKLFTRFGEVEPIEIDANGILDGIVEFNDGAKLTITDGNLTKAVRANGTVIDYVEGQVDKITIADNRIYSLTYIKDAQGNTEDILIKLEHETDTPEFSLVPFLQKPELLLEPNQGPEHPVTFIDDVQIVNDEQKMGGGSLYFDGTVDHLEVPNHDDWDFGSGDFTVEAWVKLPPGTTSYRTIASKYMSNAGWIFFVEPTGGTMKLFSGGNVVTSSAAGAINDGEWHHLAVVRDGNSIKFFKDGVQAGGNLTAAATYDSSPSVPLQIGTYANTFSYFKGHMDELRISKGVARYTSNFTPHTEPHEPDAETKLLLNFDPEPEQTPALESDISELTEILTPRTVHNTLEDRFNVRSIYNLDEEEAATGLHSISVNGNTSVNTTDSKLGDSSAAFDGSGDTITSPSSTDFDFGSGDFTIESWVQFPAGSAGYRTIASKYSGAGWIFFVEPSSGIMKIFSGGSVLSVTAGAFTTDEWYHIAVVKTGNTIKFFRNGVQVGSDQAAAATYNGSASMPLQIGVYQSTYSFFKGNMDELRISNIARWTENFVPATTEYTRDENTKLLLHFNQEEFDNLSEIEDPAPEEDVEGADSTLYFAKLSWDPIRGESYEFATDYLPEWMNVSLENATHNQGYVTRAVRMELDDNLPATTSDLIDMNGDGLVDRVYLDASTTADFWWVQFNNGQGFEEAIQWTGVDRYWDPTSSSMYYQNQGSLRHYQGRMPGKMGDLIDLDGDGLPDRVLTMVYDNEPHWYVQWNNGSGFDAAVLWADNVQTLSVNLMTGVKNALSMRGDEYQENVQELVAELIDLDGDGLLDRVVRSYVGDFDHWLFQKNLGREEGFADAVIWENVDNSFHADANVGGSLSWYNEDWAAHDFTVDLSGLYDMNGDGLLDRVLTKLSDPNDSNSRLDWYVQFNNGDSFDAAILWDDDVREVSGAPNARLASGIHGFKGKETPRRELISLVDVTGDGLLDRVTLPSYADAAQGSWWVEINSGLPCSPSANGSVADPCGFKEAVEWVGIEGNDSTETSIGQDAERFRMNDNGGVAGPHGRTPDYVKQVVDLKDLNGDGILDRMIFNDPSTGSGQATWLVQFGTGEGFLPGTEMEIVGLIGDANKVASSAYDHVHLSIKAAQDIPASLGTVKISLVADQECPPETPAEGGNCPFYQEWTITDLTDDWQDKYLKIDRTKANASDLRIEFLPAEGEDPNIPIFIDNLTFMTLRPGASEDWLDRMLAEEMVIAEVQADEDESLNEFLGLTAAGGVPGAIAGIAWDSILNAETLVNFDTNDEVEDFKNFYGTTTKIENGVITQSVLPDDTVIKFNAVDPNNPQTTTQTIEDDQGNVIEDVELSYGRVRTVESQDTFDDGQGNNIKIETYYDYEFVRAEGEDTSATPFGGSPSCPTAYVGVCPLAVGTEITVVSTNDPANTNVERYIERTIGGNEVSELISRTQPNGMMTSFYYNEKGELTKSVVSYKGRIRNTFYHGKTEAGLTTLKRESGIVEEYSLAEGTEVPELKYNTTAEGYRYTHSEVNADKMVKTLERKEENYALGNFVSVDELAEAEVALIDRRTMNNIQTDSNGVVTQFDVVDIDGDLTTLQAVNGDFIQEFENGVFTGVRFDFVFEVDKVSVTAEACLVDCETVKRIALTHYVSDSGELAEYVEDMPGAEGETELSALNLTNGAILEFSEVEQTISFNAETGESKAELKLLSARVIHEDGTITEYREGKPYSVQSATGNTEIIIAKDEFNEFINENESAVFHYEQAEILWNETVEAKWKEFRLPPSVVVQTEYRVEPDGSEILVSQKYAEGTVELYDEDGRIEQILSPEGERLILRTYDEFGKPIDIDMEGARRNLTSSELQLRSDLAIDRAKAVTFVAERELVLDQTIESEYVTTRNRLIALREELEAKRGDLIKISAQGKSGKVDLSEAFVEIQIGFDEINKALDKLADQRADALAKLAQQVSDARDDIETQSFNALVEIDLEVKASKRTILRQELMPIVYDWYRDILGRDPSSSELQNIFDSTNYDNVPSASDLMDQTGNILTPAWLQALINDLNGSDEFTDRTDEVDAIKSRVTSELEAYLNLDESEKLAYAASLGIEIDPSALGSSDPTVIANAVKQSALVEILLAEVTDITTYLNNQTLHFGQSAYLALEAMLEAADKTKVDVDYSAVPDFMPADSTATTYNRLDLATQLILIDVLTGVITPIEKGDLIISLFAMRTVAERFGVEMNSYALSYDVLKATFEEACADATPEDPCDFELVAHIDGNHYVIITGFEMRARTETVVTVGEDGRSLIDENGDAVTEEVFILDEEGNQIFDEYVTFIDPGAGHEDSLDVVGLTKEEFLATWQLTSGPHAGFGYIFSRGPPTPALEDSSAVVLTEAEEMEVRGAFFGFFKKAFKLVFDFIVASIKALVRSIVAVVKGVVQSILTTIKGFGNLFAGLFTGNFDQALKGLFQIFVQSGADVAAGLASAVNEQFVGASEQLQILGVSEDTAETIVSGGKIAVGIVFTGLGVASGNPQLAGIGISLIGEGTGEILRRHTDLSPKVIDLIEVGAQVVGVLIAGGLDPNVTSLEALKLLGPRLAGDLGAAGVVAIGSELGIDNGLVNLIKIPVRAVFTIGAQKIGDSFGNQNPNVVLDQVGGAVQTEATTASIDFGPNVGSEVPVLDPGSKWIDLPVHEVFDEPSIWDNFLDTLQDAAISVSNFASPVAFAAGEVSNFNQVQVDNGLSQTLNDNLHTVFDRSTIENIMEQGGVDNILSFGTDPATLPDGSTANSYKFSDTTELLFDNQGNFVGQIKNGSYEIGEFSISDQEFVLQNGTRYTDLSNGGSSEIFIQSGQIQNLSVYEGAVDPTLVIEAIDDKPIFVQGPDNGGFLNGILDFVKQGVKFVFENGSIIQVISNLANEPGDVVDVPSEQGQQADVKDKRTYLLNGIGNVNPVEDGAPEYMVNLRNVLRDVYGFTNTALIGLYDGIKDFSNDILDTIIGGFEFLQEFILTSFKSETQKVIGKILSDLSSGIINSGDTINVIAYSGGGQRILEAAWFLPVKINLLMYGAPAFVGAIPSRIQNIQSIWGTKDLLKDTRFLLNSAAISSGNAGNLRNDIFMENVYHFDRPEQNEWGYHCDDLENCNNVGQTYLEWLAELINGFFDSLT